MHAEVDQHAAARFVAREAGGRLGRPVASLALLEIDVLDATEDPGGEQRLREPRDGEPTEVVADRAHDAPGGGRGCDRLALRGRPGEWLLDEDVDPVSEQRGRDRRVQSIRRRDDRGVDETVELAGFGERMRRTGESRERARPVEHRVDDCHELHVVRGGDRRHVIEPRDGAAADDPEPEPRVSRHVCQYRDRESRSITVRAFGRREHPARRRSVASCLAPRSAGDRAPSRWRPPRSRLPPR